MNIKRWEVRSLNKDKAADIAAAYGFPAILAMLLQIRGAETEEDINELVGNGVSLADPYELIDMDAAVERIFSAVENEEKIAVYGDYDADGVTATSIVYTYLKSIGADVSFYIPQREGEGYGMNIKAVEKLHDDGVKLIITVDNGISSVNEVKRASELGIDTVITDHHRPQEKLPEAVAVVDAYRPECECSFRDFSGAGIAYKLVSALETEMGDPEELEHRFSDLAALGTIADVVPLSGENRAIVRMGLKNLQNSERIGIKALLEESGADTSKLTATSVAFTVVPRINATGRMGSPDRAVRLLTGEDESETRALAEEICRENDRRRSTEAEITEEVISMIEADKLMRFNPVIVVSGENWHHGVVGIVAAKITERYGKPCMVISASDTECKGSGRSVEGFNLFEAISSCKELMLRFGGHPMAAGITIEKKNIDEFRRRINIYAYKNYPVMPAQCVQVDCKLMPAALKPELPESLSALEPFGSGNPAPLFGLFGMKLESVNPVGGGNHLRLNFSRAGVNVSCMAFCMKEEQFPYIPGTVLDLAVSLDSKLFRGSKSLTVIIRDMKLSGTDSETMIKNYRAYEKFRVGVRQSASVMDSISPEREEIAALYRTLRTGNGWNRGADLLAVTSGTDNIAKLFVELDILMERKLIDYTVSGNIIQVSMNTAQNKTDIYSSSVFGRLKELRK